MKNILLLTLVFFVSAISAQSLTVLVVDDSSDDFGNSQKLADAIDSSGYEATYFDAQGDGVSPSLEDLNLFDLVVWHTSTSGDGLHFWNQTDTVNTVIQAYLEQPTANLWLVGNDYMFDRYGLPSVQFSAGDFVYDYLGIAAYASQTNTDDGGAGVPFVSPVENQPIPDIQNLYWTFATLWWADGFLPAPGATPIYQFDGTDYPLAGHLTSLYYETSFGSRVMTYGFDIALVDEFDNIKIQMGNVLDWWSGMIVSTDDFQLTNTFLQAAPNTFRDQVTISIQSDKRLTATFDIFDSNGKHITRLLNNEMIIADNQQNITWNVPASLAAGLYYGRLQDGEKSQVIKLVKQ